MKGNFENSFLLTKFILRRERVISSVWIIAIVLCVVGLVPGMDMAIDFEAREALRGLLENPAIVAMFGYPYALDQPDNFGALYVYMMLLVTAVPIVLMNIFLVVRHTRADEEQGRYEVVRSLPTGRLANINSTMISVVIINAILAVIMGLGMYAVGDASMDFNGSMLFGASLGAIGLVFAAIAALFSQLSSNARGASAYSFIALAVFYFLRAPGDMNPDLEILALISPLGLMCRTEIYWNNNWLPILILIVTAIAVTAVAYWLNSTRDIDQGIIPAKPGKASGSIRSPFGLAMKLLRTSLIAWIIGMLILGASYATVFEGMDEFVAQNEMYQNLILGPAGISLEGLSSEEVVDAMNMRVSAAGFTVPELFASMITMMMSMVVIAPAVMFVLRARGEEKDIRAELLIATPVSRIKYLAGFTAIAFVATAVIQLMWALGMYGVGISVLSPDDLSLAFMLKAAAVNIPAIWVMIGVTVLLIGVLPKYTGAIWGYFAYTFMFMMFGRMGIFDSAAKLTPFGYVPNLPMDEINMLTMAVLVTIAAALTVVGFFYYNKRDMNAITH